MSDLDTIPEETDQDLGNSPLRSAATIHRVYVEDLFGLYTYELPKPPAIFDRTPILYGENGLGKTSILRILFHLLSSAGDRGHRSYLGRVKFKRVEVTLSNGVKVTAQHPEKDLLGTLRLEVHDSGNLIGGWTWIPKELRTADRNRVFPLDWLSEAKSRSLAGANEKEVQQFWVSLVRKEADPREGEAAFLKALKENVPPIYLLSADRILSSDSVVRRPVPAERWDTEEEEGTVILRDRALRQAIQMASRHLSLLGVRATRLGSQSIHTIYLELVQRLLSPARRKGVKVPKFGELIERLRAIFQQYEMYAKYGLTPRLVSQRLLKLLESTPPSQRAAAGKVIAPYVESLARQSKRIVEAYVAVDTLVSTANAFLFDKSIGFSIGEGLTIQNKLEVRLQPRDLSSGEQQLLLLFCHIATTHKSGGIFIIDEPEISLNVKWQRKLVDSLLHLDLQKNLQFVLASHSMEILSGHRDNVVALKESM